MARKEAQRRARMGGGPVSSLASGFGGNTSGGFSSADYRAGNYSAPLVRYAILRRVCARLPDAASPCWPAEDAAQAESPREEYSKPAAGRGPAAPAPGKGLQLGAKKPRSDDFLAAMKTEDGALSAVRRMAVAPTLALMAPVAPLRHSSDRSGHCTCQDVPRPARRRTSGAGTTGHRSVRLTSAVGSLAERHSNDCKAPGCPLWNSVHLIFEEKVTMVANRDGGVENLEIKGDLMLRISEADRGQVRVQLANVNDKLFQFKVVKGIAVVYGRTHIVLINLLDLCCRDVAT